MRSCCHRAVRCSSTFLFLALEHILPSNIPSTFLLCSLVQLCLSTLLLLELKHYSGCLWWQTTPPSKTVQGLVLQLACQPTMARANVMWFQALCFGFRLYALDASFHSCQMSWSRLQSIWKQLWLLRFHSKVRGTNCNTNVACLDYFQSYSCFYEDDWRRPELCPVGCYETSRWFTTWG
jgi:hypothetical protein